MIAPMNLTQVETFCGAALNAQLHQGNAEFSRVSSDTRKVSAGDLFVALRGENFDAHEFLKQAAEKNACGLVVEKFDASIALPQLVVSDTLLALGKIAELNRNAFNGQLLAITGSNGKTTVKTMLANILAECGSVLATQGNLNNHIGVPLTLLDIEKQHQYAVIEMGASAIGEIAYLCKLAKPHLAMVNNVMPAHLEGFGSIKGVAIAKGEIYQGLLKEGVAIVNMDEPFSSSWLPSIKSKIVRVSLSDLSANCYAADVNVGVEGVSFSLRIDGQTTDIQIKALGVHSVRNALMAAAMAFYAGASLVQIKNGLEKFSPVAGRMSFRVGFNQASVIDDSYNANPGSVRAAIDVLAQKNGQRILVLGDLAELGVDADELHAELGKYAQHRIDGFFTFGILSRHASKAFGHETHFSDRDALVQSLKKIMTNTTTLLVKGSRSAKMDLVVSALCDANENRRGDRH
jgi:UDP-N-acetylmuramoyl-tripeptide--D-alanyl-D-alanine ligase